MALKKREYTHEETVITAENLNEIQDAILELEEGLFAMDNVRQGEAITINDAASRGFISLNIYGKTTQDGIPTPEAPVDLVSSVEGDNISIHVCGKNLFTGWIVGGVNPDNGITNTTATHRRTDYIPIFSPGQKYSISNIPNTIYNFVAFYDAEKNFIRRTPANTETYRLVEPPLGAKYFISTIYENTSLTGKIAEVDAMANITQIEMGDTTTEYERAKQIQKAIISTPNGLHGIPVASGGNYTDADGQQWICDEIDLARGVYVKRIHTRVIDGNSTLLVTEQGGYNRFEMKYTDEYNSGKETDALCSHFVINAQPLSKNTVNNCITAHKGTGRIFARFDQCSTTEEFAAWLTENPITFIYRLATPIEIPLSEADLAAYSALYTYRDHTTVSNDGHAYMELEYVMDAKKYIDSLMGGSTPPATGTILPATVE